MKFFSKLSLTALASLLTIGTLTPYANASTSNDVSMPVQAEETNSDLEEELIEAVDQNIQFDGSTYFIENESELETNLNAEDYEAVVNKVEETNNLLNQITDEELAEAKIEDGVLTFGDSATQSDFSTNEFEAMANRNGIDILWWGYRVYLSDDLTRTTSQLIGAGAGGAAIAAAWMPVFTAPTALVKAIAASLVIVGGGVSGTLVAVNDGNGVYIRFTGLMPAQVIFTGIHPQ
ncbi:hypothetical protein MKY91_03905 [Alkalicoccobacillus gibsonii]|uniref:TMhelix containing protein n=1 Tax=Alkalicoccobacillus gibsonii TaxID=79881 RepID=A0ABU9VEI6_9BACI